MELSGAAQRAYCILSLFLAFSAACAQAANVGFARELILTSSADGAYSVAAADVDGDGDLDAFSASEYDNTIAWYENVDGAGRSWASHVIFTGAVGAKSVFAADLDGDGDPDALSASAFDDTVAWYENVNGGTEWVRHELAADARYAACVTAGDINGDGRTDAVSASHGDNTVAWYENLGPVTPWPKHTISTTAAGAYFVVTSDIDGDGDLDALVACRLSNSIAWYENLDGSGAAWAAHTIFTSAKTARAVYAADLDGDGDMDALSASQGDNRIAWHENLDGTGTTWASHTVTLSAPGAKSVIAVDLDADGDLDLVTASRDDDAVRWFENKGGAPIVWVSRFISRTADGARQVCAGDVDADGDLDLFSASCNDDTVALYRSGRRVTVTIAGAPDALGEPAPFTYGTHVVAGGTVITSSVLPMLALGDGTQAVCDGWALDGPLPATGAGTTAVFSAIDDVKLTWTWRRQHWLATGWTADVIPPHPAYDYALLCGGDMRFTGTGMTDAGDARVHANGALRTSGEVVLRAGTITACTGVRSDGDTRIEADVSAPDYEGASPANITGAAALSDVDEVAMPDLPLDAWFTEADRNGQVHHGNLHVSGTDLLSPTGGILWVNGRLKISGSGDLHGCFIAFGDIEIETSGSHTQVGSLPALISLHGDIKVSGGGSLVGLVYAMEGGISISGAGRIAGSLICAGDFDKNGAWEVLAYRCADPGNPIAPGGSVTPASGWQDEGSTVLVSATPAAGSVWTGWTGDVPAGSGAENPLSLRVSRPTTLTAVFASAPTLSAASPAIRSPQSANAATAALTLTCSRGTTPGYGPILSWNADDSATYRLYAATDLSGHWSPVYEAAPGLALPAAYENPMDAPRTLFFRVVRLSRWP